MFKDFSEKREIDVTVRRAVCDICGDVVKEGEVRVRVTAILESPDDYHRVMIAKDIIDRPSTPRDLDICSTECLKKNIGGIALVIDTKVTPELKSRPKPQSEFNPGVVYGGNIGIASSSPTTTLSISSGTSSVNNSAIGGTMGFFISYLKGLRGR